MIVFDLNRLYGQVFGKSTDINFNSKSDAIAPDSQPLKFDIKPKEANKYSALGTPYYEKIKGDFMGRECFLPVTIDGLKLPYSTIRINSKKTIIETSLINRKGSIIEQINIESYKIRLRGFLIGQNNQLPDEDITALKDLYEKNESVVLRNALSDIFLSADDKVVVRSIEIPEVRAVQNVRPFELDIMSDSEFTLIVE